MTASSRRPPRTTTAAWLRRNLFETPTDAVLTIVLGLAFGWLAWTLLKWGVIDATWTGQSKADCRPGGACWAIVTARWRQVFAGFYPEDHLWRVAAAMVCLAVAVSPVVIRRSWSFALAPLGVVGAFALLGGAGVLPRVPTEYWGGVFLNVLIGVSGCVFALPLGVLLAMGRRSPLPVVKAVSIGFIELVRGAPLITLLFMSSVVLPLFVPAGVTLDKLMRALVVITLFASAYMAEAIRGGLQAVPTGQGEAARALGLGPTATTALVILPQALRISIPALVNTFIGLFKDTTLVYVIALLDVTGVMRQALADFAWQGHEAEAYAFIAIVFWVVCFAMSRWSASLERDGPGVARPTEAR